MLGGGRGGAPSPSRSVRGRGAQRTQGMPTEAGNLNPPPTQFANHHAILRNGFYHVSDRPGLGQELNPDYVAAGLDKSLID